MNPGKGIWFSILLLATALALVGGLTYYFNRKHSTAAAVEKTAVEKTDAEKPKTEKKDIFEIIGVWFAAHPKGFGFFVLLFGVFALFGAVFNWDWIFRGPSFNLKKIEGIANFFGRGFARIYWAICAAGCIISGILVIILA